MANEKKYLNTSQKYQQLKYVFYSDFFIYFEICDFRTKIRTIGVQRDENKCY